MPIKLVITDLDGTLLRRDKSISDYSVSVFKRLRDAGVLIAFATARSEPASARFAKIITPDVYISNGGAQARYGDEILYRAEIPITTTNSIINECLKYSEIEQITVEADNGYFNSEPVDTSFSGWVDFQHSVTTDFTKPVDYDVVNKISIKTQNVSIVNDIASSFVDIDVMHWTNEDWVMIKSHQATKELALQAAAKRFGIALADVAAFGDDWGDIGMLSVAGYGVAPENAIPEVKAVSPYKALGCDSDGVAHWIEDNIFNLVTK